ncbi:MAG: hypothetical protein IE933_03425 [Sphingomonadales bacterium]|nr:hypothetical protein [Sphingomonadales bacterium]MBD3772092.1 hypothetical protein [Paracoccaceae bacterium]
MADREFLPHFDAMRASLVARGLLGADYRLTDAGNRHVEAIKDELAGAEAPSDPAAKRVYWRHDFRQRARERTGGVGHA